MIVYRAVNKINGKVYIGKTIGKLNRRIASHLKSKSGIFPRALRKYGVESFEFSIIDIAYNMEVLHEKEKYWIRYYESKVPNGYNLTDGGEGMAGYKYPEETIKKKSNSMKGKNVG